MQFQENTIKMRINKDTTYTMVKELISIDSLLLRHQTQLHIAILIKRGRILEIACNSVGSRSKGPGYSKHTIHAERAVLKKIGDVSRLNGASLIVIRISKGMREIVDSEPCHACKCHLEKCMKDYGLKHVYYST